MPSDKVSQEEVLRSAQFDLLRQLQKAVRTVILTATVSNSCVNCSHGLCAQLFRLIRSCLLAGCRRFKGAKLSEDFLFLLVVPEYIGAFHYDLEFIAHLCVGHHLASFVRQLFDDGRVSHFYSDCAIMRDEELHLAFVSSLMALEPVNFHPDSPDLAQQCLSASLENLRLIPVQWSSQGSGKLEDHLPASQPDKVLPRSDLGARPRHRVEGDPGSDASGRLAKFIGSRAVPHEGPSGALPEVKTAVREDPDHKEILNDASAASSCVEAPSAKGLAGESTSLEEASDQEPGPDVTEKLEEAALALNETEELVRQLEAGRWAEEIANQEKPEALLSEAVLQSCVVLDLEDPEEALEEAESSDEAAAAPELETEVKLQETPRGSAADLGAEIADAFGMGLGAGAAVPEVDISVRDLVAAGQRARRRSTGRPVAPPVPEDETFEPSSPRQPPSPQESDEALDAILSLEGLWQASRQDTARRLMRASLSSVTSQTSVSSASSPGRASGAALASTSGPHLLRLESSHSGELSDSDSETNSSRGSASNRSSASFAGSQVELPVFSSHQVGVHLEWKLKMHPRLSKDVQVSRQRGLCPGCRQRLPSSLFQGPRYCHYLGYYFCTSCHNSDIRVIPARVAERWDFEPRKVCAAVAKYLDLQVNQPLVPITSIRQTKVSSQQILTEIHLHRQKLSRIKGIVAEFGCEFQETLSGYLSQLDAHVARSHEHYAMQDLIRIELQGKNCPLFLKITRVVTACATHIQSCPTCSKSAERCPICASSAPLYPFEVETFHACSQCKAVFHKACFRRAGASCPFCLQEAPQRKPSVAAVQAR